MACELTPDGTDAGDKGCYEFGRIFVKYGSPGISAAEAGRERYPVILLRRAADVTSF